MEILMAKKTIKQDANYHEKKRKKMEKTPTRWNIEFPLASGTYSTPSPPARYLR